MQHAELVAALVKPGSDLLAEMTANDIHAIHMIMGLSGEVGELLDAIKKHVMYRKPLDMLNVIEELGDIEFYLQGLRAAVGVSREECLDANILKLTKRYPDLCFSNEAAQARADKAGE